MAFRNEVDAPWYSQPQEAVELARNDLTKDIGWLLPLNGTDQEIVRGGRLTRAAAGTFAADERGQSLRSTGSAACASIPIDLSPFTVVTVSFWIYWNAYANDDDLALEYGANYATNSGFLIDPNSGAPASGFMQAGVARPAAANARYWTRPAAATWHHYMFMFSRLTGTSASTEFFLNGASQGFGTAAGAAGNMLNGAFGNSSLFIFSRNNASLFGAGRMFNLVIRPQLIADAALAREEFLHPWDLYAPRAQRIWVPAAGGLPTLSASTFKPGTLTSTGWTARITAS